MSYHDVLPASSPNPPDPTLFAMEPCPKPETPPPGRARVRRAERYQVVMQTASLDSLLPDDHRARLVWE